MNGTRPVEGVEQNPVYLVCSENPMRVSADQYIWGASLRALIADLSPGERIYLVDYATRPGRIRLTLLV